MSTIKTKIKQLFLTCREKRLRITLAESCTGGLICGYLTSVSGSSDIIDRSFVTYSNGSKKELLGVSDDLLFKFGAVSKEVAGEMAKGALTRGNTELALSVTGIAGPKGGTKLKPKGLVFIAIAHKSFPIEIVRYHFPGNRDSVRRASVEAAIDLLIQAAEK